MEESDVTSPQFTWDVKEEDVKIEEMSEEEEDPSLALVNSDIKVEVPDSSSDNDSEDEGTADGSRPQHKCKYSTEISCCKHKHSELKDQEEGMGVPFKCLDCEEPFTTDCGLYNHVMKKHFRHESKTKGYRCSICTKSRKSWRHLARHMIKYHGIRYSQMLRPTPSLREGLMTILSKKKDGQETVGIEVSVSKNEQFPCSSCHKSFFFKHNLMDHVKKKHQLGKYQCSRCKQRFRNNYHLNKHLRSAHNLDGFVKCLLCAKRSPSDIGLYHHLLTKHQPNVKYSNQKNMDMSCSICVFFEKGALRLAKHMIQQHGVKSSELSLPSRTSDGFNLTIRVIKCQDKEAHIAALFSDAHHRCHQCGRPFFLQHQLVEHMHDVHGVDASLKCLSCHCSFKCDRALYSHTFKVHTPKMCLPHQMTCSICGAKQNGCMILAKHMVSDHSLRYSMLSMPTSSPNNSNEVTILVNKDASGTSMKDYE